MLIAPDVTCLGWGEARPVSELTTAVTVTTPTSPGPGAWRPGIGWTGMAEYFNTEKHPFNFYVSTLESKVSNTVYSMSTFRD